MNNEITFFAETTFRNIRKKFGIKTDDRRRHIYIVGKTGMGKTVMMENMAIQDIKAGRGVGFIDPHGEAAERLLDFVPSNRINDVVYFNPADLDHPIAFNVMEKIGVEHRHLVASGLMGVFKKIWPDVWSARMEYILNNSILALLEYPNTTLLGINRMLADSEYRKKIIEKITDPVVKAFWVNEFARYTQRYEVEATAAIQNKVGQFISNPLIRNIIGQVKSKIDMRKIMDEGRILLVNLSKGKIGEDNSLLLGALLITKLQLAAMSRVDILEEKRKDFFLYVDEFQNFATESFVNILSEARKYRLALTLGHQYIAQMEESVGDAVFGNVGTMVSFRVGAEDAEYLEKEFIPEFTAADLVNLAKYNIYLKLMIDGIAGRPFSAETLSPFPKPKKTKKKEILKVSRERYGTKRKIVEDKITRWSKVFRPPATSPKPSTQPVLYDAKCSLCGKWTKVIFPPDGMRPVYCKGCLKKIKKSSAEEAPEPTLPPISLREAAERTPVPFSPSKKKREEKKSARKKVDLEELRRALKKIFK
ncbi:type IV secretion system DNA-binding domain-containing protein [Patescibacteria group bacterium]|nr:type IV secretion system DNA-binding domain-containing protein [Patescibacteria group bacterium]